MTNKRTAYFFAFYGLFLIAMGAASYLLLDYQVTWILVLNGLIGFAALTVGHYMNLFKRWAFVAGFVQNIGAIITYGLLTVTYLNELTQNTPQNQQNLEETAWVFLLILGSIGISASTLVIQLLSRKRNFAELVGKENVKTTV